MAEEHCSCLTQVGENEKYEKRNMEELHQQKVNQILRVRKGAGLLHKPRSLQRGEEEHRS